MSTGTFKLQGKKVSLEYFKKIKPRYANKGFSTPKWIQFCEIMLERGWQVYVHEAVTTVSKYVFVVQGDRRYKIRFSNHIPNKRMQAAEDCDFYVGISHAENALTTEQVLDILLKEKINLIPVIKKEGNNAVITYFG